MLEGHCSSLANSREAAKKQNNLNSNHLMSPFPFTIPHVTFDPHLELAAAFGGATTSGVSGSSSRV